VELGEFHVPADDVRVTRKLGHGSAVPLAFAVVAMVVVTHL
jgi:hypothetical protein